MTIKEWLEGLANSNVSSEEDSLQMQNFLRVFLKMPQAVVTSGVVYLEGRGTLEAPPASINWIAKVILDKLS